MLAYRRSEHADIIPLKSEGAVAGITSAFAEAHSPNREESTPLQPPFILYQLRFLQQGHTRERGRDRKDQGVSLLFFLDFNRTNIFPKGGSSGREVQ